MAGTTFNWESLKTYIGVEGSQDDQFIVDCFFDAQLLITDAITTTFRPVPESILKRMILEVGQGLYNRKAEPSGTSNMMVYEGGSMAVRTPSDPLYMIRPMLRMYVVPL